MKVLHINLEKSWGGGEKQLEALINGTDQREINNHLFVLKGSALAAKFQNREITVSSSETVVGLVLHFKELAKEFKPDIVYAQGSKAHTVALAVSIIGPKLPLIVARRVNFPIGQTIMSKFKYRHPHILHYICVSQAVAETCQNMVKEPKKLTVVYSGIDLKECKSKDTYDHENESSVKVIGVIGGLQKVKRLPLFIDLAEKLLQQDPTLRFLIAGDGPEKSRLESIIVNKGLTRKIELVGFVENIHEILEQLDLLISVSANEGFPNNVLEAFCAGVPVLGYGDGGIKELVRNDETGLLATDETDLLEKAQKVITGELDTYKFVENARKYVQNFGLGRMVKETIDIYHQVIEDSRELAN